ncbi:hypothetical protein COLO4_14916 [Corchorus olitorius]|uniref:Ankyrin repeat-containing protein n=1 Tax=Corchorus olitorius TaxID=93759 RepID=A0A1R3JQ37_9ROSI|nr:hypothetical protein COLO4_14916 [Corchorus olitorius]
MTHDHINAKNSEGLTALDLALSTQEESHESKSESDNPDSIYNMLSIYGGLTAGKMSNSSAGDNNWIRSFSNWLKEKPKSSIKNVDALRSKMSSYKKVKIAIARGKGGISESMRNTFLVVTVLIITATYTASLQPPKKDKDKDQPENQKQEIIYSSGQSDSPAAAPSDSPNIIVISSAGQFYILIVYSHNTLPFRLLLHALNSFHLIRS